MSEERDRLEERLDSLFASTRPRRGFEDELWSRIQARRSLWARLGAGLRRVQVAPVLGGLAALVVVVLAGGLILLGGAHGGGSASSGYSGIRGGAAAPQEASGFGTLPRPAAPSASRPAGVLGSQAAPKAAYSDPVTVTAVTAAVALPASLPVTRYQEVTPNDADRLAASAGARPSAQAPLGALRSYAGDNFTLVVYPTDPVKGTEPRVVIAPGGPAPKAATPDDVDAYLARYGVAPPSTAKGPVTDRGNGQEMVRWTRVLAGDITELNASWEGILGADTSIIEADGAFPLVSQVADYAVASGRQLVALAKGAGGGSGPKVVLDSARVVYVVASDGTYGYFEPAVLYTGHFTQGGVVYEKQILVPAVAPQYLR